MKQGIMTEIDWSYIGATLANEGDDEQIKFFKAFCTEISSWDTYSQGVIQMASIAQGLTSDEKELISHISYEEE